MVRHQFKIGYFNEMKHDLHSAQKAYLSAYNLLLEFKATEHNASEIRSVAGFISYRLCRLGFRLNMGREAIAQFRKHMDNFGRAGLSGPADMAWEHAAWQAGQAAAFAQLFLEAQQSAQAQHPGIYFHLAANYAISRSVVDLLETQNGEACYQGSLFASLTPSPFSFFKHHFTPVSFLLLSFFSFSSDYFPAR
jgi:hypothetical protein